jgi:hypothetical protein
VPPIVIPTGLTLAFLCYLSAFYIL